jgi:hypothetical protein
LYVLLLSTCVLHATAIYCFFDGCPNNLVLVYKLWFSYAAFTLTVTPSFSSSHMPTVLIAIFSSKSMCNVSLTE